jgi:aspartate carbamoyltransferase catalytic subunit
MNLLSITDLSREDILDLCMAADEYRLKQNSASSIDTSKLFGLLFFQPSTRTRIGFEAATWKLGYKSIILNTAKPSISKGWSETIPDTIRTMNAFVNGFFIRHDDENIFNQITPYTDFPVINCGNGYDEHPTQALIDAYAIWVKFGRLDNLTVTFIGDTRYSRSAHSLALLLAQFTGNTVNEITPKELSFSEAYIHDLKRNNSLHQITKHELGSEQVLYSAGFPPINPAGTFSQEIVRQYIIDSAIESSLAEDCVIMNPLPRIDEIDMAIDSSPKAYYFKQNELGLYMRMAVVKHFAVSRDNI